MFLIIYLCDQSFFEFYQIFHLFKNFQKMCVRKSGLSPWIKPIGVLFLICVAYYESFPFRKCNKIENRKDGASSNINDFTLKLLICCIVVPGPFPLQPYYSRGKNVKLYSTSHSFQVIFLLFLIIYLSDQFFFNFHQICPFGLKFLNTIYLLD